jgi:FkbM family methyltransferase
VRLRDQQALRILGAAARLGRRLGFGRAVTAVVDAADGVLLRARTPPLAARVEDFELTGYLRHRGFLEYVARGMTEESFYRSLVVSAVDCETTFVDAGAHIGIYTILVCRRARRVLAFEPDPYNAAALKANIASAGCSNVEIRSEALADAPGHAQFRSFRSTFSGSLAAREVDDYTEFETHVISLDNVLDPPPEAGPLVVKLDLEGAERLALTGMARTLRQARRIVLFVEINPEALAAGGSSAEDLLADLRATQMECAFIDEVARALLPLDEAAPDRKGNVVCRKPVEGKDSEVEPASPITPTRSS